MSVLVFIEEDNGAIKKSSFEAMAYSGALANQLGTDCVGVAMLGISNEELKSAGKYGVSKVVALNDTKLGTGVVQAYAAALSQLAESNAASVVVMSNTSLGEAASSRIAIKLGASVATNVIGLPDTSSGFKVKRSVYTSKAFCTVDLSLEKKVLTVKKNSFEFTEGSGDAIVENADVTIDDSALKVVVKETKKQEGDILLPEAELVVSAGRGLKGPENWGMVEELAKLLGAATACSKPVSDMDWRPHHEHVGQTGIKISPNLYIAIGISGAIQHLAGVSSSKVIVVINTDAEAPFFKAADYGIVGDAFEVVPKLIEAFKNSL